MAASHHDATLIDDQLAHHMPGRNSLGRRSKAASTPLRRSKASTRVRV
jgi:hypothetical protein